MKSGGKKIEKQIEKIKRDAENKYGKGLTFHFCMSEDMHPYECDGIGKCIHCDRRRTATHIPENCALCDDDLPIVDKRKIIKLNH